jgi:hypothetical protein
MIAFLSYRGFIRVAACVLAALLSAGCAPDSTRYDASGFDAYLKQLGEACQPLQIGDKDLGEMIRLKASSTAYDYFLDATSRLYYNRITPVVYRQSLVSFFGPGTMNDRSFDCIVRNLPVVRPRAPD